MTGFPCKQARLRLDPQCYRDLCRKVLERDDWRCQECGRMSSLRVHHCQFRGRSGSDTMENLTTLCADCHRRLH